MKTRSWRSLTWVLGIIAVVALVFGLSQYRQARSLSLQLQGQRQRSLYTLISHVESMEASLAKARAASTVGQQTTFLTSSYTHAQSARDSLSQVSVPSVDLTSLRTFVARVGDYSQVLSQRLSKGGAVKPEEWSELTRLEEGVKDLAGALMSTAQSMSTRGTKAGLLAAIGIGAKTAPPADALNQGFSEISTLTQSIPSPVYDGPFSEKNQASRALARPGAAISLEDAKRIALGFLHPGEAYASVSVGTSEGSIPSFTVRAKRPDGSEVMTSVAKQGGAVIWAQDGAAVGPAKMDMAAARDAATKFLLSKGFTGLKETGWRKPGTAANRVVFTYVPEASVTVGSSTAPVMLYPDTVKVEVALDTGRILAFDQKAYLSTHDSPSRTIPEPLFSRDEARATLKTDVKVVEGSGRLTVIPVLPTTEALAWEFRVTHGPDTYLVYVNAMTGTEEAILQLIENDTGAMAV